MAHFLKTLTHSIDHIGALYLDSNHDLEGFGSAEGLRTSQKGEMYFSRKIMNFGHKTFQKSIEQQVESIFKNILPEGVLVNVFAFSLPESAAIFNSTFENASVMEH